MRHILIPDFRYDPTAETRHREALAFLSQTRQTTLLTTFTDALTRGGPGGLPRPIELHAHDPLRYVGDMLAWVHQAIAAEREFLEGLFGVRGDGRMVGSVRSFGESVEEEWMSELMDAAVGKLCTPLKVSVSHPRALPCSSHAGVYQGARAADGSITGEQYHVVQDRKFVAILFAHNAKDDWRDYCFVADAERVSLCRCLCPHAQLKLSRCSLTKLAYQVFYDAIDTEGRSLLRVPPVR